MLPIDCFCRAPSHTCVIKLCCAASELFVSEDERKCTSLSIVCLAFIAISSSILIDVVSDPIQLVYDICVHSWLSSLPTALRLPKRDDS